MHTNMHTFIHTYISTYATLYRVSRTEGAGGQGEGKDFLIDRAGKAARSQDGVLMITLLYARIHPSSMMTSIDEYDMILYDNGPPFFVFSLSFSFFHIT